MQRVQNEPMVGAQGGALRRAIVLLAMSLCLGTTVLCPKALAQCVMCAQSAQATAQATGGYQPLAVAALVLLVPTMLILAAGAVLVWRLREPAASS